MALTSDNQAYVRRYNRQAKASRVFRLNRARSTWEPVNATAAELYGADGDNLVFAQPLDVMLHLSWYPQPSLATATNHPQD